MLDGDSEVSRDPRRGRPLPARRSPSSCAAARAPLPGARGERHVRRRSLRLPPPRRARDRRALRQLRSRLAPAQPHVCSPPPASGAPPLAIDGAKGIVALEAFILARLFMFQQVYFHKATRAAEWMIRAILARAAELMREGVPLPGVPAAIVSIASRTASVARRLPRARRRRPLGRHARLGVVERSDPRRSHAPRARALALQDPRALRQGRRRLPRTPTTSRATSPERAGSSPRSTSASTSRTDTPFSDRTTRSRSSFPAASPASRATFRSCSAACATKRSPGCASSSRPSCATPSDRPSPHDPAHRAVYAKPALAHVRGLRTVGRAAHRAASPAIAEDRRGATASTGASTAISIFRSPRAQRWRGRPRGGRHRSRDLLRDRRHLRRLRELFGNRGGPSAIARRSASASGPSSSPLGLRLDARPGDSRSDTRRHDVRSRRALGGRPGGALQPSGRDRARARHRNSAARAGLRALARRARRLPLARRGARLFRERRSRDGSAPALFFTFALARDRQRAHRRRRRPSAAIV